MKSLHAGSSYIALFHDSTPLCGIDPCTQSSDNIQKWSFFLLDKMKLARAQFFMLNLRNN